MRSANRWSQFIALLLNQILGLNSLRDVYEAMKAKANKMYHLGATPIARSTLARVNEQQNYEVFKDLFFKLYEKMQRVMPHSKFHCVFPRPKKIQDDWKVRLKGNETLQRIVFFYEEEEKDEYAFITNAHHLNAKTIADLYKERADAAEYSGLDQTKSL